MNNLNTYQKPSFSLAEMCLSRASIDRPLFTGPAFCFRERKSQNRPTIIYRDNVGEVTTRAALSRQYGVDLKTITNVFLKYDLDFIAVHYDLGDRL